MRHCLLLLTVFLLPASSIAQTELSEVEYELGLKTVKFLELCRTVENAESLDDIHPSCLYYFLGVKKAYTYGYNKGAQMIDQYNFFGEDFSAKDAAEWEAISKYRPTPVLVRHDSESAYCVTRHPLFELLKQFYTYAATQNRSVTLAIYHEFTIKEYAGTCE